MQKLVLVHLQAMAEETGRYADKDEIVAYIRSLEREHRAMRTFIKAGGPWTPCSDFEPDCLNCQGCKLLSSLNHDS